jgi:hypothetical protein
MCRLDEQLESIRWSRCERSRRRRSLPTFYIEIDKPAGRSAAVRGGLIVTATLSPARIVSGRQAIHRMNAIDSISIRQERCLAFGGVFRWINSRTFADMFGF